jgi:hypothetical protein
MLAKLSWLALAVVVGTAGALPGEPWTPAARADASDTRAERFETYIVRSADPRLEWAVVDDLESRVRCVAPNNPGAGIACYTLPTAIGTAQALRRVP